MAIERHGEFTITNPSWILCFDMRQSFDDYQNVYRYTSTSDSIIQYYQPELPYPYYQGDYLPISMEVSPIRHDNIGRIEVNVMLNNADSQLSNAFLSTPDWRGNTLWLSHFYTVRGSKTTDYNNATGRLVFYGQMNKTTLGNVVEIEALGAGNFYGSTPRMSVREPVFNWVPEDGMVIALDDQGYIIKRRD
jgi:hypothetical protein